MVIQRPKRKRRAESPDMRNLEEIVSEKVLRAAYDASEQLSRLGIEHALIGGLAVGANGFPRATADIDFLVRHEDALNGTLIVSFKPGVPIVSHDVNVDYITVENEPSIQTPLTRALGGALVSQGMPVLAKAPLVMMKLVRPRRRDLDDVRELLIDNEQEERRVRRYIQSEAPHLLPALDRALREE